MVRKSAGVGTARSGGDCGLSECDKALKHPRVRTLGVCQRLPGEAECLLQKEWEICLGV